MSNHDLLMRHGITVEDNPFNEMAIELDFSDCVNFSEQLFDQKQKWLRQSEIQNIERQVLYQNRINVQLLQYALHHYCEIFEDLFSDRGRIHKVANIGI